MRFTDCTPPMQKFSKIEFLNREPLLVYGSPKSDDGGGGFKNYREKMI